MPTLKHKDEVYGAGSPTSFNQLSDVNLSNLQNGQVPMYNSTTQEFENADLPTPPTPPSDLDDLDDVEISNPSANQVLAFTAGNTNAFENKTLSTAYLSDVGWSEVKTCAVGDTTVTFDDLTYSDSWSYQLFCDDGTGKEIPKESIIVNSSNEVEVTFKKALENVTLAKLHFYKA